MIWFVAIGGAVGSAARFALSTMIQRWSGTPFPIGTLVINITGSLLLGFLIRYALGTSSITPEVRALLTTGFCGGYTTFSTFSYESIVLLESGQYGRAGFYVVISVVVSLAATLAGMAAARELLAVRQSI
ncbi:MAG TPA: fluoride efflux transporter CrcB [Gemmatimonadaceae bacterium]|nr:fluoride efflux transporter CrcB [Gemmatimonadaceae bacterium]